MLAATDCLLRQRQFLTKAPTHHIGLYVMAGRGAVLAAQYA